MCRLCLNVFAHTSGLVGAMTGLGSCMRDELSRFNLLYMPIEPNPFLNM